MQQKSADNHQPAVESWVAVRRQNPESNVDLNISTSHLTTTVSIQINNIHYNNIRLMKNDKLQLQTLK